VSYITEIARGSTVSRKGIDKALSNKVHSKLLATTVSSFLPQLEGNDQKHAVNKYEIVSELATALLKWKMSSNLL